MNSAARVVIDAARLAALGNVEELDQRLHNLRDAIASFDRECGDARQRAIRRFAVDMRSDDGEIEFDEDCAVSESSENGAYVEAWLWIPFDRSALDKRGAFGANAGSAGSTA